MVSYVMMYIFHLMVDWELFEKAEGWILFEIVPLNYFTELLVLKGIKFMHFNPVTEFKYELSSLVFFWN